MDEEKALKAFEDLKETLEDENKKVGITDVADRYTQFEEAYEQEQEQGKDD